MHRGRPMGESFDHRPAGWIRQGRKCCIQLIHNRMVVDYPSMSSVDFGVPIRAALLIAVILAADTKRNTWHGSPNKSQYRFFPGHLKYRVAKNALPSSRGPNPLELKWRRGWDSERLCT